MLHYAPTISADPTMSAVDAHHSTATLSNSPCQDLAKMTIYEPASLSTLPPEIILYILGSLDMKNDWFSLAVTCRRVSIVVIPELDKYNATQGENYAFWYACVSNNPAMLLRHISMDATVVNRHLTSNFSHPKTKSIFGRAMSPLAVAIKAGQSGIVQLLLANGADANLPDRAPAMMNLVLWYPINWAVASRHEGSVAIIGMLKDHSANLNQVPKDWSRGVVYEYPKGMKCAPIFRLLLLDKPRQNSRRSAQLTSCEMYNDDFKKIQDLRLRQLKALLEGGADPNKRYDWDYVTPVFFLLTSLANYTPGFYFPDRLMLSHEMEAQASMVNDIVTSFLNTLRDFGADLHGLGNTYFYNEKLAREVSVQFPETPLHTVCRLNDRHKPLIYWFLRNGSRINTLGKAANTPLMAYCDSDFKDMYQFQEFLKQDPDINQRDMHRWTALHCLCANRRLQSQVKEKAVRMMLDMGADPTAVNKDEHTPVDEIPVDKPPQKQSSGDETESPSNPYDPHHTVREMLRDAAKEWEEMRNKARQQPALAEGRPSIQTENQVESCESERVDHQSCDLTRTQRGAHANSKTEKREDGLGDGRVSHRFGNNNSTRRRYPGNRGHSQGGHRRGALGSTENHGSHGTNHQPKSAGGSPNESVPQEQAQPNTRGGFNKNSRGGRYNNSNRGSRQDTNNTNKGAHRGGI
ncbi:hypothetical protein GGR58DRAFT_487024 [Xylaria digitata]|nr:hypothetical protein GGR58DRAFT_487024 [Xylaria digitata]